MKSIGNYLGAIVFTIILLISFNNANAQNHNKRGMHKECKINNKSICKYLNLTDAQNASFKKIKLEGDKNIIPLKNKLNELSAKKRTLMTAENINKTVIENLIKDMSSTREKIQIIRTNQFIKMRQVLNTEQKIIWDKKTCNHKNRKYNTLKGNKNHNKQNRSHSNCCK